MLHQQIFSLLFVLAVSMLAAGVQAQYEIGDTFNDTLKSGGKGPDMVIIPAGTFALGGGGQGRQNEDIVRIEYRLAFGAMEITVGQYRTFLSAVRSHDLSKLDDRDDALPMAGVSFDEAESYVTWLSRETGQHYRLPSGSEWEYAARANTSYMYHWGDKLKPDMASCLNCGPRYAGEIAPVGSFAPNSWGIYDMHGNVWEWAKDCIDSNTAPPFNGMPKLFGNCEMRELRGGSAKSDGFSIRAGARAFALRAAHNSDVGFRVVMDVPE